MSEQRLSVRARVAAIAASLVCNSCTTPLDVPNSQAPNIDQVFANPSTIEQTIATGYLSCHRAVQELVGGALHPQMVAFALEGYGTAANFGVLHRANIPRAPVHNDASGESNLPDYKKLALGGRLAANAVTALDRLLDRGGSLGGIGRNLRARAFGFFVIGCHQGWLAMAYDSAAVVTPGIAGDSTPLLSDAVDVMSFALAMFDSAIAVARHDSAQVSGGFPLPNTWVRNTALSRDDFIRLVRSHRARFRAGVARTRDERELVDWQSVIADVDSGIARDFTVDVGGGSGWVPGGNVNHGNTRQVTPMYYGMADVSGGYDAWLALPLSEREAFLIVTPDRRWPQGSTLAQQQINSVTPTSLSSRPYIANATGPLAPGSPWGQTYYFHDRLAFIRSAAGQVGAFPSITKAEMDLLAAEGYLHLGNVSAAASRIDVTRVGRGGLPGLAGVITAAGQPVPGGANCVPRVPDPATNFTSAKCGDIWEAMKWEKRMETAFTGYGQWYFDGRGWGDLVEGSATEFPVPWEELAARQHPSYNLGGGFYPSSAPRGTYGF